MTCIIKVRQGAIVTCRTPLVIKKGREVGLHLRNDRPIDVELLMQFSDWEIVLEAPVSPTLA